MHHFANVWRIPLEFAIPQFCRGSASGHTSPSDSTYTRVFQGIYSLVKPP